METDTVTAPLNDVVDDIDDNCDEFVKRFPSIASEKDFNPENTACCAYRLPILHPHGPIRLCWDVLVMFVLVYTCIEVPFSLAFDISLTLDMTAGVWALCIDCFLLMDVCLNFRTAYYDKYNPLQLVTSPRAICRGYIQTWFLLDLFTSIPFEFLLPTNEMTATRLIKMLRVFRLLRLVKLLRFFRMIKTFNNFLRGILTRSVVVLMNVVKILLLMMLTAHYIACIWWYTGVSSLNSYEESWVLHGDVNYVDDENMTIYLQYIKSFYFSVVTLFTTGYGDITPKNALEEIVCCGIILTGTCFFGYFIGAVSSLVAEGDRIRAAQIAKVEEAQAFCISKRLPSPLSIKVLEHLKYYWSQNFVFDEFEVLNALPPTVQREIGRFCSQRYFVDQLLLFQDLPEHIRGLIAFKLKAISCADDEYLFHEGQFGKAMYIQVTGVSLLHLEHDHDGHGNGGCRVIKRGQCFGYFNLIGVRRNCSLKTLTYSEFYCLEYDDIRQVLQNAFPRVWNRFWRKIKQRVAQLTKHNQHVLQLRAPSTSSSSPPAMVAQDSYGSHVATSPMWTTDEQQVEQHHLLKHPCESADDDDEDDASSSSSSSHCCVNCKRRLRNMYDSILHSNDVRYRDRKISLTAEMIRGKMDKQREHDKMAAQTRKYQRRVQNKVLRNPTHCYHERFVDDLEHSPIEDDDESTMTGSPVRNRNGGGGGKLGNTVSFKGRTKKKNVGGKQFRGNGSVPPSHRSNSALSEVANMVTVQIDKRGNGDNDDTMNASMEEIKNGELDTKQLEETDAKHEESVVNDADAELTDVDIENDKVEGTGHNSNRVRHHQTTQMDDQEIEDAHMMMMESRNTEDVKMESNGVHRLELPQKKRKKKKRNKIRKGVLHVNSALNSQDEESVSGSGASLNSLSQSIIGRVFTDEEDDDEQRHLDNLAPLLSNTNKDTDDVASIDIHDMAPAVGLRKYSLVESQTTSHHDE